MVADATDGDAGRRVQLALSAAAGAVAAIDAVLLSAFENGMLGDDVADIKDTDQVGELLDVDNPAGAVRHAVIIAADSIKAIVADAPFHSLSTASKRCSGSICSSGCSAAKASATTRWVVP